MLTDENNWLREELVQTRENLQKIEMELIEKNSKIEHLEFINNFNQEKTNLNTDINTFKLQSLSFSNLNFFNFYKIFR